MATREHALYRFLPEPSDDAANAGCYLTGDRGPCVDTGIHIEWEGTLTIGVGALQELCEVAGFSFNAEGLATEQLNAELERENQQLKATIAELEADLSAVGEAVRRAAE